MGFEDFKASDASQFPIGKLVAMISRSHATYLNHKLEKFNLNSSQIHFLFEINRAGEINQKQIASSCNIDKGAVARSITKLENQGLIFRKVDSENRRQNLISLSEDGEGIVREIKEILAKWEEEVFDDNLIKKEILQEVLKDIAIKAIDLNNERE